MKGHMKNYDSGFIDPPDDFMVKFHSDEYIELLKNITEENFESYKDQANRFGFSADCPCPTDSKFYDFCELYSKGECL